MKCLIACIGLLVAVASAAAQPAPQPDTRIRPSGVSAFQLSVWNSPEFQRDFANSYKSETDIEPSVSPDEVETLREAMALITEEQTQQALDLLLAERDETTTAVYDFTIGNLYFQRAVGDGSPEEQEQAARDAV